MKLDRPMPDWDAKSLRSRFLDRYRREVSAGTLDAVAHMLFEIDRTERVLEVGLTHIGTKISAGRVDVGFGDPSKRYHAAVAEYRETGCEAISMVGLKLPNTNAAVQRVWRSQNPVAYDDIPHNALIGESRGDFAAIGAKAMLAQRLDNARGGFAIVCADELEYGRSWSAAEQAFMLRFCSDFFAPILDLSQRMNARRQPHRPSPAELRAIRLASQGLSYKEIARQLTKSVRTIETQFRNARLKTGAANQAELVRVCEPWL